MREGTARAQALVYSGVWERSVVSAQPFPSVGFASVGSTNCGSEIFRKKAVVFIEQVQAFFSSFFSQRPTVTTVHTSRRYVSQIL